MQTILSAAFQLNYDAYMVTAILLPCNLMASVTCLFQIRHLLVLNSIVSDDNKRTNSAFIPLLVIRLLG